MNSRRDFLRKTIMLATAGIVVPSLVAKAKATETPEVEMVSTCYWIEDVTIYGGHEHLSDIKTMIADGVISPNEARRIMEVPKFGDKHP